MLIQKIKYNKYKDGKRNGKGKEFYSNKKIKFEGEYLDGKRWKGKGYDPNGNLEFGMEKGLGYIKEYFSNGKVKLEGKYVNGVKHGFFKLYNIEYIEVQLWEKQKVENSEFYYLEFEGQYINGERNGKGKENNIRNILEFEGEYLNGKRNGKGEIYFKDGDLKLEVEYIKGKIKYGKEYIKDFSKIYNRFIFRLVFEGEYNNGEKNGKGKEYNSDNKLQFKGGYLNGKRWNGIEYNYHNKGGLNYIRVYKNGEGVKKIECTGEIKVKCGQEILSDEKLRKEKEEKEKREKRDNKINIEEEKNKIRNFIKDYGVEVKGLPNIELNDENISSFCSRALNFKIFIDIIHHGNNLCSFVAPICSIPTKNKEEFYKKLLIANSFGIENGGAVLSIDNKKDSIILSFTFIVSTFSSKLFRMVLINFVTAAEKNMAKYEKLLNQS